MADKLPIPRMPLIETPYAQAVTFDPACFPRAETYRAWSLSKPDRLRERTVRRPAFSYSERHLQCVWFDPEWRPATLSTREGESVTVESPGRWNQEAGPDFHGAVLRIGPDRRRVVGDVEVHIHPADWTAHGHGNDPRYRQVRVHVTYFPGAADPQPVPGAVHIVLRDALTQQPGFVFEHIDVAAYPYAARADRPPCAEVLARFPPAARQAVLFAAGEERLRRKAERLQQRMAEQDPEQALYEEMLAALGYKQNKVAGRQLACLVPVAELRTISDGQPLAAYAILLGAAGLLPSGDRRYADPARWVRQLWDVWWRQRARYENRAPTPEWRLDGVRPANHPARRLMAAALMFIGPPTLPETIRALAEAQPGNWVQASRHYLESLHDEYLGVRLSLTGRPRPKPVALIGATRSAAILTNVWIPWLAAQPGYDEVVTRALDALPPEGDNGIVKQTAFYLFGRDHAPSLYRSALARQGLHQIFQDFCLNDRSRCAQCGFPEALTRYEQRNIPGKMGSC